MGGHGGLNILPQKRWNVYNYENREKVRRNEEAAAREEQLQREQSRRERLRRARGLHHQQPPAFDDDSRHLNLFDGLSDFSSLGGAQDERIPRDGKRFRKEAEDGGSKSSKKRWRAEDEKYELGYGLVGKGVKALVVPLTTVGHVGGC
ncbi:hypothetical protein OPV22_030202 [Ensete ventricosum]|uniref:CBF1-interacting co-repressor CIR N-terminal domain-containing protein n=1 Tax=Ensete ventricosum TaxID=4639 RepID=A0AAV8Q8B2_ENSVE|nr:hypothetical protein OPV22_030202 [Ensete ventricosum]